MRGKPVPEERRRRITRIIPAHAGQTRSRTSGTRWPPDHPRACGANKIDHADGGVQVGSSPRMRGKPLIRIPVGLEVRIIPAHAGQTPCAVRPRPWWPDHPRACGANFGTLGVRVHLTLPAIGFQQQVLGHVDTDRGGHRAPSLVRANTTYVPGSTSMARAVNTPAGVNACTLPPATRRHLSSATGSSPRMRGKRAGKPDPQSRQRIIPAHAGQTLVLKSSPRLRADHPRACGANGRRVTLNPPESGSSPRMRGKPEDDVHGWILLRIIPAHAGQTGLRVTLNPPESDHPRACGANPESPEWAQPTTGSSPRMRGKHKTGSDTDISPRIIPAHAGQTGRCGPRA